ncbi:MAG: hypothetical protein QW611_06275, partial [Ignisphaera sp.]
MSYRTKKRISGEEDEEYLDKLVEKLENLKQQLTLIEPLNLKYDKINSREEVIFDPPIQSNLLIFTVSLEKVIIYDRKLLKVVGIEAVNSYSKYPTTALIIKSDNQTDFRFVLSFSEILGFLFYSGAYEKIREGEYRGSTEFAETILDVGEIVYNNFDALELLNTYLPRENGSYQYTITYIIDYNIKPWLKTRYMGFKNMAGENYSLFILDGELRKIGQIDLVKSSSIARSPLWI